MKALRFHAAKDLRIENITAPMDPGPDEVRVRNACVGICGTDLHEYSHGPIFIHIHTAVLTDLRSSGMSSAVWSRQSART